MMTQAEAIARQLTTLTGTVISKDDPLVASYLLTHSFMQESHKKQIETLNGLIKGVNQSTKVMTELAVSNSKILDSVNRSALPSKSSWIERFQREAIYGALFFSALSFIVLFKHYYM